MAEKYQENAVVLEQKEIASGIFRLVLQTKEIAAQAKAGQFVSVYSKDPSKLLPRPISLCEIDKTKGTLTLVYRVKAFLIGGGIGIPPILQLAREMKADKQMVLGFRDSLFLMDEFQAEGQVYVATEDGSAGTKGNVLDAICANGLSADIIYACGPTPMLCALKAYAEEHGMVCYISMEERMACGIGACLACVCKTKDKDAHSNVNNKRICKEGPVFDAREVEL